MSTGILLLTFLKLNMLRKFTGLYLQLQNHAVLYYCADTEEGLKRD